MPSQLTRQRQLTNLRRRLASVEQTIIEAIAERERLLAELRWQSQVVTDGLAAGWLEAQGRAAVEAAERIVEG